MFTHSDEFVEPHVFIFNWKLKIIFNVQRQHLDMTLTENSFSKTARVKIIPFGIRDLLDKAMSCLQTMFAIQELFIDHVFFVDQCDALISISNLQLTTSKHDVISNESQQDSALARVFSKRKESAFTIREVSSYSYLTKMHVICRSASRTCAKRAL